MDRAKAEQTETYSRTERILGQIEGNSKSPTVVVFAGIHGNEKAGVKASYNVLKKIGEWHPVFKGNLYIILGNIGALNKNVRYQDTDLNRVWKRDRIDAILNHTPAMDAETVEQIEIFDCIKSILNKDKGPFYFLDLHTTSSNSVPFITISDSLNNRKFSSHFPIPVVLGIEEYLEGPLLTFINDHGHIALGFEGGQHVDERSVRTCEAFLWKALVHSKCLDRKQIKDFKQYESELANLCCSYQFFDISFRYVLKPGERFEMRPGFENFERIEKHQYLAKSNGAEVQAHENGRIFMPLYQKLGEDGYFILQRVSWFWLKASLVARKWKINNFLRIIPGVQKDPENSFTLIVDPKIARFMAKEIFHLFGYRQQIYKDDKLHFIKRDRRVTAMD